MESARIAARWFASQVRTHRNDIDYQELTDFEGKLADAIADSLEDPSKLNQHGALLIATSDRYGSTELIRSAARRSSSDIRTAIMELPPALACIWVSKDKVSISTWLRNPETIYSRKEMIPEEILEAEIEGPGR